MTQETARVVDSSGVAQTLGELLTDLLKSSHLGIAGIARRCELSRSFLYLLMSDQKVPSLDSLVVLLEATGARNVRPASLGEPGDVALTWRDRNLWVRLPQTSGRARRSRNTMRSLTSAIPQQDDLYSRHPSSSPPARGDSYGVNDRVMTPRSPDDRRTLLGDLLQQAAELDADQLRVLIEHVRLLRRE